MNSLGCPIHGRSLLTKPQRHGAGQISRHCPNSKCRSSHIRIPKISDLFTKWGNDIWGVYNAPAQLQVTFLYIIKPEVWKHGTDGLLFTHRPSMLFILLKHTRHKGKEMKHSGKAFKSKLNPINDSFKRSVPYIYKSIVMGLRAIWLLTFAMPQNSIQATWVLTSSVKTPHGETFPWGKSFTGDFCFKLQSAAWHVQPAKDLVGGAMALFHQCCTQKDPSLSGGALHTVHSHALLFYIFITSCFVINTD